MKRITEIDSVLTQAELAIRDGRIDDAISIAIALRSSLNHKAWPELASNLEKLYTGAIEMLDRDKPDLVGANKIFQELAKAFSKAQESK